MRSIEQWPIDDRTSWLARRKPDVTASVVGALLGVHEYITPYELWALKSGLIAEDPEETPAMERGTLLEPVAVELLRRRCPDWRITQPKTYYRDPSTRIGATPDALVHDPERGLGVIQIKTVEPSSFRRKWKDDDGVIQTPLWIAVQALIEAHLTGATWAAVAPMRVGYGLDIDLIDIPLHPGLIDRIESEVAAFWRSVETGQPPDPDLGRDSALIERMYAPTGETIDLSGDNAVTGLVDEREQLSAEKKAADERLKAIKAELLLKLGGASAGRLADGRIVSVTKVSVKEHIVSASTHTRITVKKARAA